MSKETTQVRLWFMRETKAARLYCKHDPVGRGSTEPDAGDFVWVPRSIAEHTLKLRSEAEQGQNPVGQPHIVTLPDWFVEREGL